MIHTAIAKSHYELLLINAGGKSLVSERESVTQRVPAEHIEMYTVVLVLRAHRIQVTLRENQVVLMCIYTVNDPAHMVKTFGKNPHCMCP